jgi:hypothetical protein
MFYIPQVFKEAATYRSKMKDLCEKTFLRYYADILGLNVFAESQVAYQESIATKVRQLIGKPSLFHFGPDDIHVSLSLNSYPLCLKSESRGEKTTWSIPALLHSALSSIMDLLVVKNRLQSSFLMISARLSLSMPWQP